MLDGERTLVGIRLANPRENILGGALDDTRCLRAAVVSTLPEAVVSRPLDARVDRGTLRMRDSVEISDDSSA